MLNANFNEKNPCINDENIVSFLNTNARSLGPKSDSLIDNLKELGCQFSVVTETWFEDGKLLEDGLRDLEDGAGYSAKVLNRTNRRGGGVAVLARCSKSTLKDFRIHNPGGYEIITVTGRIKGCARLFFIAGCYMPPNLTAAQAAEFLQLLVDST